jgi:hypothetical protein
LMAVGTGCHRERPLSLPLIKATSVWAADYIMMKGKMEFVTQSNEAAFGATEAQL